VLYLSPRLLSILLVSVSEQRPKMYTNVGRFEGCLLVAPPFRYFIAIRVGRGVLREFL
jgi:hypothetical protein